MHRRTVLALCASGLAGTAGCLSTGAGPGSGPGDDEATDGSTDAPAVSPSPDATPVDGVVVDDLAVRKAVAYESLMGSGGVLAAPDRQYVVASVRSGRSLEADAFAFETDADSWEPGLPDTTGAANYAVAGREGGLLGTAASDGTSGYLAFAVPSPLEASNPRIRLTERTADDLGPWPLSAAQRDRLAAPAPRFELESLSVPESVSQGEQLDVSLTARNVSGADGRFLAAVYWPTKLIADDDESRVVEGRAAAGETVSADLSLDTEYVAREPGPVPLTVEGHVRAERSVRVTDVSTRF